MTRARDLRDDLDDLILSAEHVEALMNDFDLHALQDMAVRLRAEIRAVSRELLLSDATALIRTAQTIGGLT